MCESHTHIITHTHPYLKVAERVGRVGKLVDEKACLVGRRLFVFLLKVTASGQSNARTPLPLPYPPPHTPRTAAHAREALGDVLVVCFLCVCVAEGVRQVGSREGTRGTRRYTKKQTSNAAANSHSGCCGGT